MTCSNHARFATHALSHDSLRALVTSDGQAAALQRLRSAQFSKHQILLAALMRMAATSADLVPAAHARTLTDAYQLLAEVETDEPAVVRDLIASPQFGAWAADCVNRLGAEESSQGRGLRPPGDAPLWADLGYLGAAAASAAFRTGHAFDLAVPLRHGTVTFPEFGTARPGAFAAWEWGRASQDTHGLRVSSSLSTVRLPALGDQPSTARAGWTAVPRLVADAGGLRLDVTLDSSDPFLDRYGTPRAQTSGQEAIRWQRLLSAAWRILAREHYDLAEMVVAVVRTLVPLATPSPTRPASSTETASFGALAMSLPGDALAMAEVLVHESHHAVLGAVADIVPIVSSAEVTLGYAPWREDPRPPGALLQGIYAHYGIARLWRQQRYSGPPAQRFRGHVEFGRWRLLTAQAADCLAGRGLLTESGSCFLSAIRARLAEWQDDPVPTRAADHIADLSVEHRVRWRLRHLVPDQAAVESLAAAWHRGARPPVTPAGVTVSLEPGPLPGAEDNMRAYLLTLRYQDPEGLRDACEQRGADPADVALAAGEYEVAAAGYRTRIAHGDDGDAWAGLAVACRHTRAASDAQLLADRPEVVAALYRRLRGSDLVPVGTLLGWLANQS